MCIHVHRSRYIPGKGYRTAKHTMSNREKRVSTTQKVSELVDDGLAKKKADESAHAGDNHVIDELT